MSYQDFLVNKKVANVATGFNTELSDINPMLFDFQKALVRWSIGRGRSAIFADTGLGKTAMQVTWADLVARETDSPVLILAPLSVSHQTVRDAAMFGIEASYHRAQPEKMSGIIVTNFEMMDKFNFSDFSGLVLDESSILKSYNGKIRESILDVSRKIPFRLSCTATPSPNDFMELGNQAEFVGVMSREEMLAMFFVHDGGDTAKWRLKGHGEEKFWEWLSTWAVVIKKPSDIGFDDSAYDLPPLHIHEHILENNIPLPGQLFSLPAVGLHAQRAAKRASMDDRVSAVADLVNASTDPWLVWCHMNDESVKLGKSISDAITVSGSDSIEHKENAMDGFTDGVHRVLVSKPKICGFGMNWQHCSNIAFVGVDHSFESMYQAIRRCWRFGQTKPVNVHIYLSDVEIQILDNVKRKEAQHDEMSERMVKHMGSFMQKEIFGMIAEKAEYIRDVKTGENWELHLGDCVDVSREIKTGAIDYTIFSPPFSSLYTYSNSDRDMGNSKSGDEFFTHFGYLVEDMIRITKEGRL